MKYNLMTIKHKHYDDPLVNLYFGLETFLKKLRYVGKNA